MKFLKKTKSALTTATLFVATLPAYVQAQSNQGFEGVAQRIGNVGKAGMEATVFVSLFLGLVAFAYAGKKMWDKANDRDDVKLGQIAWPMLGGAFMMALYYVATLTIETLGGSAADIGNQN